MRLSQGPCRRPAERSRRSPGSCGVIALKPCVSLPVQSRSAARRQLRERSLAEATLSSTARLRALLGDVRPGLRLAEHGQETTRQFERVRAFELDLGGVGPAATRARRGIRMNAYEVGAGS